MTLHTLDLLFQGAPHGIAAYLVVGPGGPVLVETGPSSTLATLVARLAEHGYAPSDIRHVLVTHIHLDHAGASGWWAAQGAHIYVHHVGAPHLIDPTKLLASAQRIYGEMMEPLWGQVLPVPAGRLTALRDGDEVNVAGLRFAALDTPGHAWHHHVFRLDGIAFTGDAAGVRLAGSPLLFLPAPPPEFDLAAWRETVARLSGANFSAIYPTHFGPVSDVKAHFEALSALLSSAAEFVRSKMQAGVERDELVRQYVEWNRQRAVRLGISADEFDHYETANPLSMSVDGMMRYWKKKTAERAITQTG